MNKTQNIITFIIFSFFVCASHTLQAAKDNDNSEEIQDIKISEKAGTQIAGVLCLIAGVLSVVRRPLRALTLIVGSVYTIVNPQKVINTVKNGTNQIKSNDSLKDTFKESVKEIKKLLKNIFSNK